MGFIKKVEFVIGNKKKQYLCSEKYEYIKGKGRGMCTCIAEIKATYKEVKKETSRVAKKSFERPVEFVTEDNIDKFLDAINIITKDLNSVTQSINELITVVRNNFCEISTAEAEDLLKLSHPMVEKMRLLHNKLTASPLYRGMMTTVELYIDAVSDFEELCHDLKVFRIDLEQDDKFQQTLQKVNEMLRR